MPEKSHKVDLQQSTKAAKAAVSSLCRKAKSVVTPGPGHKSAPSTPRGTKAHGAQETVSWEEGDMKYQSSSYQTQDSTKAPTDYNNQWYSQMMQVKGISR